MNKLLTLAGAAMAVAALAACSPGINEGIGHRITFDADGMVVHAVGRPDAHIGKDGSLAIDDHAINVTPAQQALLQRYYGEARSMMQSGKAVGKQGAAMAKNGIGEAVTSLLHGDSSDAQKKLEAQSNRIDSAVGKLCTDINALHDTQQTLATEIPAFAPYASGGHKDCTVTSTTTVRDDNAVVANSPAIPTSMPPAHPGSSGASPSNEP
jgi:hypothetical protein